MCEDNQRRAETNPLRIFDSKDPNDQALIDTRSPVIGDYLDESSRNHFAASTSCAGCLWCSLYDRQSAFGPRTGLLHPHHLRVHRALLLRSGQRPGHAERPAGRRPLRRAESEMLGGPKRSGHRLRHRRRPADPDAAGAGGGGCEAPPTNQVRVPHISLLRCGIAESRSSTPTSRPLGVERNAAALALARELRRAGLSVEVGDGRFRLKKSFEAADRVARHIVILGEDELATNTAHRQNLRHRRANQTGTGDIVGVS
jgi:histidyl-tRNA synthetase